MIRVFADACYWIALLNRNDQLHDAAAAARKDLAHAHVVTTDEVLVEVLNFFGGRGPHLRSIAVQTVEGLRADSRVHIVEQSRASFDGGLSIYRNRTDKKYSLVDCVSFALMNRDGITKVLTEDGHFVQEGFVALLRVSNQ